ncbi:MAG: thioredoxin family protein [Alistipes sp.]|jgi:thioredoxin 1|nr:thioredoxin family protein [Alistipes sp.]
MRTSDFDRIINSERLMLVDFYATWCGACKAMDPTLDRVALALSDSVTILRIDIGSSSSRELVRRYNIVAVPTLMLFFRGDILWRDSGIIAFDRLCHIVRRHQTVGAY